MGNKSRSGSASSQTEGLPTPPPSPWQVTESIAVEPCRVEVASSNRPSHSQETSDTTSTPTASVFAPRGSSILSTSTLLTPTSDPAQFSAAISTSTSTAASSQTLIPRTVNVQVYPPPVTYPHQLYGTYHLGRGRRGAVSGPSSDYYEGKYDGRDL